MTEIWQHIERILYPELKAIDPRDRDRILRQAKKEPLDIIEWIGIIFGLLIAVSVTRYSAAGLGLVDRLSLALANFVIAVPFLTVLVGPFLIRRTRRGLRRYFQGRSSG